MASSHIPTPTPSLSTAVASASAVVSVITTSINIGNNVAASTLNSFTTSLSSTTTSASTTSITTIPLVTTQPPINCISLNSSYEFAILASSTITNTGTSNINGDLGLYPGTSVTKWWYRL